MSTWYLLPILVVLIVALKTIRQQRRFEKEWELLYRETFAILEGYKHLYEGKKVKVIIKGNSVDNEEFGKVLKKEFSGSKIN